MTDKAAVIRLRDALAHDEAADRHMEAAVHWRDQGQAQRAVLEVKNAMLERQLAQLAQDKANWKPETRREARRRTATAPLPAPALPRLNVRLPATARKGTSRSCTRTTAGTSRVNPTPPRSAVSDRRDRRRPQGGSKGAARPGDPRPRRRASRARELPRQLCSRARL